jgi:RND family efflux transporter MFP subunit
MLNRNKGMSMMKKKLGSDGTWLFRLSESLYGLIILSITMGLIMSCNREKPKETEKPVVRPIKMMTIKSASDVFERELPGVVRAARRVDLAFKVSGPLTGLEVEEGQAVKKGQRIAKISPRDFETAVDRANALALEAEQHFQRYKELYVRNQVSKADFDRYKSERDVAKAQQKRAQDALADTNLKAPFAGVIAKRFVENFQEVQAKQPIVSLQDISAIEILVDVPEEDMSHIKQEGQIEANAEFAVAPGKKYPLALKEYSTEADPKTQTYQVTLLMAQPEDIKVYSGMTATVHGRKKEVGDSEETITLPLVAVTSEKEKDSYVWVVNENMAVEKRSVTTGEKVSEDHIQIIDGIQSGETIAISAIGQLKEGLEVRQMPTY